MHFIKSLNIKYLVIGLLSIIIGELFSCNSTLAQNCQTSPSTYCGTLTANSGLSGTNVFCIGDSVSLCNNGSTGTIDSTYICWGDGTVTGYSNVFTGCKIHYYNFPPDSCVGSNGSIAINIVFEVKDNCSLGSSIALNITPISIKFKPKAAFSINPLIACVYEPITISDQSCPNSNSATYLWDFGDGTTSTSQNPNQHSYSSAGNYNITLTITNSCGTSSVTHLLIVKPPTIVAPLISLPNSCVPANFIPDVNSQNAISFLWSITSGIGNITIPTDSQPTFTLNSPSTYNIHLAVQGCCLGPVAKCTWDTSLTIYSAPSTSITKLPDFCGNASFNPLNYFNISGGPITNYSWNFPGGTPSSSTSSTPGIISYLNLGTYNINLALTTPCGQINLSDTFAILPPTIIHPSVILPSTCSPVLVIPNVNSQNATGFNWIVSGGNNIITSPQDSQPSISFNSSGNFAVHLAAIGCCTAPSSDCVWDTTLNILQGPTINQSLIPDYCGSTILSPSSFISVSGVVSSYSWIFSGGIPAISTAAIPGNINYAIPGSYIIKLDITSPCGPKNVTDTFSIAPPTIILPISNIPSICTPINFTPTINSQNASSFLWTNLFGNALITSPSDSQPTFSVTTAGLINIQVAVTGCCIDPQSICVWDTSVTIQKGPDITISQIPLFCSTASINPNNYFATSGAITTYNWTFQGGTPATSNNSNPGQVNFNSSGNYIISLTLNGSCGSITKSDTIFIGSPPSLSIIPSSLFGCDSIDISFTNNSPSNQTYNWLANGATFISGTSNTSFQPVIHFNLPGSFGISVDAFSSGCPSVTNNYNVTIGEAPDLIAIATIPNICDTVNFLFSDYFQLIPSISDSGYLWEMNFNGINILTNTNSFPPLIQIGNYGQYIAIASVWNACDTILLIDTFNISPPAILTLQNDTIVCKGSSVLNLNASPLSGNWTLNGNPLINNTFDPNSTTQPDNYLLYTYGTGTCEVKDSLLINVFGADLTAGNDTVLCQNNGLLNLTSFPSGGTWNGIGIINTSTGLYDPSLVLTGIDSIYYSINDPVHNCNIKDLKIITVLSPSAASFNLPDSACINQVINFNDTISGTNANWNFGDSPNNINSNATTHSYINPGIYAVTLILENQFGCKDTIVHQIVIAEPPNAVFSLDLHKGCSILTVNITNLSNFYGTTSYKWDYGNFTTGSNFNPGIIQFAQGSGDSTIYHILLIANNGCGSASYEDSVVVYPIPVPEFGIIFNDSCSPATVHFANVTTGNPQQFFWYINGIFVSSDSILPPQVFVTDSIDSTYFVMLVSSNYCGSDTIIHPLTIHPNTVHAFFNTDILFGCKPLKITFTSYVAAQSNVSWDFGDGNFGYGDTLVHTYDTSGTFIVWQRVDNYCGFDSTSQTIEIFDQPKALFTVLPLICGNLPVLFNNTSPGITSSIWDFGDGAPLDSMSNSPSHFYNNPGNYNVSLIAVANGTLCRDTFNLPINILSYPIANFSITDNDGCAPFSVSLISTSNNASYFNWDLGNGDTLNGNPETYSYVVPGTYSIHLTAIDNNGCKDDTVFNAIIVYPVPTADFSFIQSNPCTLPSDIQFQNLSSAATSFEWNFDLFGNSNVQNPTLNFNNPALFNTSLIAYNTFGCSDTISKPVKVFAKPIANFSSSSILGCPQLQISFTNNSQYFNQSWWSFGDGAFSVIQNPSHSFTTGTYNVLLIVGNDSLCFDTISVNSLITVYSKPTAYCSFYPILDTIVNPSGIYQFLDSSLNSTQTLWDFGDGLNSTIKNPIHRYFSNGEKYINLIASDLNGCSDTCRLQVSPEFFGSLFIPNAFSPDAGTDETKYFIPKGAGLKDFLIEVYSPFGQRVWYSSELSNGQPTGKWDGTFNDKPLPQGAYAWKAKALYENGGIWQGMKYPNENQKTTGTVIILR